jgi:hypothetical protein
MADTSDLEKKIEALQAQLAAQAKLVADLMRTPTAAIQLVKIQKDDEWERCFAETKIVSENPDHAARAKAIAGMVPAWQLRTLQHMPADEIAKTLDAATKTEKEMIARAIPQTMADQIAVARLPVPARLRLTLRDPKDQLKTRETFHARVRNEYAGIRLIGSDYHGGEIGSVVITVLQKVYESWCSQDPELVDCVASGRIVLTPVSDDESRQMLLAEYQTLKRSGAAPAADLDDGSRVTWV